MRTLSRLPIARLFVLCSVLGFLASAEMAMAYEPIPAVKPQSAKKHPAPPAPAVHIAAAKKPKAKPKTKPPTKK